MSLLTKFSISSWLNEVFENPINEIALSNTNNATSLSVALLGSLLYGLVNCLLDDIIILSAGLVE